MEYGFDHKGTVIVYIDDSDTYEERTVKWEQLYQSPLWKPGETDIIINATNPDVLTTDEPLVARKFFNNAINHGAYRFALFYKTEMIQENANMWLKVGNSMGLFGRMFNKMQPMLDWLAEEIDRDAN